MPGQLAASPGPGNLSPGRGSFVRARRVLELAELDELTRPDDLVARLSEQARGEFGQPRRSHLRAALLLRLEQLDDQALDELVAVLVAARAGQEARELDEHDLARRFAPLELAHPRGGLSLARARAHARVAGQYLEQLGREGRS